jgi:hypothetical protein
LTPGLFLSAKRGTGQISGTPADIWVEAVPNGRKELPDSLREEVLVEMTEERVV